jgi:ATP-binding cassette, subfamily F, member 3
MDEVEVREQRATISFRFAEAPRSGKEVVRLEGMSKAFGPKVVYRGLSAQVQRGERVAIIGPNGAGKTTLLRIVAGELPADAGDVKLGHSVVPGYYAQHHFERGENGGFGSLDPRKTILDTLWDIVPDQGEAYVRSVAGGFLFSGDDVEKPIGVLSGGERARVALARILLLRSNLLLLDEPTNHLDLASSEALIDALKRYDGTMLFVSHNRSFLNGLATRVWEVKDGGIVDQPGNLDDWLYHQKQLAGAAARPPDSEPSALRSGRTEGDPPRTERDRKRAEAEARNARYAREKPLRDAIARIEARIAELEAAQRSAEAALADPALYQDFARARPHVDALAAAKVELARLYSEWEAKHGELETLGS